MDHIYVMVVMIYFAFMSKKDAFNLIKNAIIIDKREHYKCRKHKCFAFKTKNKITFHLCIL